MQANISITLIIFTIVGDKLMVFAPKDLPTEKLRTEETLDRQTVALAEKSLQTAIHDDYGEQLDTIADSKTNSVSIVYYMLLHPETAVKIPATSWKDPTAFTNRLAHDMLEYALQRLQWKLEYTNVVYSLLPEEFTLSELQKTYEIILNKQLDKRNFRKKILSLQFVIPTRKKRITHCRPATMYQFKNRTATIVKVFS